MNTKNRLWTAMFASTLLVAPLAQADGHEIQALKNQVQLLMQRIEQLEQTQTQPQVVQSGNVAAPVVTSGNSRVRLNVSGQINRGVLVADDGENTDSFHVDNDASSSRLRLIGEADLSPTLTVGTAIEVELASNSTAAVNQNDKSGVGSGTFSERRVEFYFDDDNWGKLWVGQGWTASEDTSEYDLSGTALAGYSSTADMAGGLLFRNSDGSLSATNVGSVFLNFDGLGRRDRVRYDTPNLNGVTLSVSAVEGDAWDAAVTYAAKYSYAEVVAALAYSKPQDLASHDSRVNGSVSALFNSGFNVTLAAGQDDTNTSADPEFYYAKLGYQANLNAMGITAFSVDYHHTDEIGAGLDEGKSYGLQLVQNFDDWSSEGYVGLRTYELERSGASFQNLDVLLLGGRVKF